MKPKYLLLTAVLCVLCTSCLSLSLKVMGIYDEKAETWTYSNNDKTVVFIPMKHIGPKAFYTDVKNKVDSLKANGFVVYLESTRLTDSLTVAQKDTVKWKIRKMLGVALSKSGYIDTINGKLMGRKFKNKHGLVNQPKYRFLGTDTINDHIVDMPVNEVIKAYEKKYGRIQLNVCDYTTPMEHKYDCGAEPKSKVNSIILDERNKHLAGAITKDGHKKIAVLYGALHKSGMFDELKAIDTAWAYKSKIK